MNPTIGQGLLSILTICRNDLPGLRTTVESVLSQSCPPDEFVVLDGGSSDGTVEYLRERGRDVIWHSEPDRGIADAFNKISRMASSEWLLFLNAGDSFVDPDVLRDACAFLREKAGGIGVCFGDTVVVDPTGLRESRQVPGTLDFGRGGSPLCHQAAFIRRDLQSQHPYDERLRIGMDYDLWLRLRSVTEFVHFDRGICVYRLGGISSSREWGEHSIFAHRLVDWINAGKRKLGLRDALGLTCSLVVYRAKKSVETFLGLRLYASTRNWFR